jgi:protein-tyrosine phosphatase
MDASRISGRLWVGGAPAPGRYADRFDVIVFTADEYQPSDRDFPDVRVRRFPIDDTEAPTDSDLMAAWAGGEAVAHDLKRGRRVLVTCAMGRNRSALIAALGLHMATGEPGARILALVRARRKDRTGVRALANPTFRGLLRSLD